MWQVRVIMPIFYFFPGKHSLDGKCTLKFGASSSKHHANIGRCGRVSLGVWGDYILRLSRIPVWPGALLWKTVIMQLTLHYFANLWGLSSFLRWSEVFCFSLCVNLHILSFLSSFHGRWEHCSCAGSYSGLWGACSEMLQELSLWSRVNMQSSRTLHSLLVLYISVINK